MKLNALQQPVQDLQEAKRRGFRWEKVGRRLVWIEVAIAWLTKPETRHMKPAAILGEGKQL